MFLWTYCVEDKNGRKRNHNILNFCYCMSANDCYSRRASKRMLFPRNLETLEECQSSYVDRETPVGTPMQVKKVLITSREILAN